MPRILFCCPTPVTSTLGGSKVYIEAAAAFGRLGWEVTLIGPNDLIGSISGDSFSQAPRLREYLRERASEYDVVEYEHHYLPFPRSDFPKGTLFVARSVLLGHSLVEACIPSVTSWRAWVGRLIHGQGRLRQQHALLSQAEISLRGADLINLPNTHDYQTVIRLGISAKKIIIQPHGLLPERLAMFSPTVACLPASPVVAFVGTFEPRKGMVDFQRIVSGVLARHPTAKFRLIGTAGLIPTAEGVKRFFSRSVRDRLDVIPRFDPSTLPHLLAQCAVGVFPSYCEGFGFGVLEMLAAGLPVVAYDAPGPPMMLPPEYLARCGDAAGIADRLSDLLAAPECLLAARNWARKRAAEFDWIEIAGRTANEYLRHLPTCGSISPSLIDHGPISGDQP